ncbi:hypothetical protein [Nonomuraea sp. NPDC050310]|uniref:hypothetical protein n=1 Tax=Nonomuraea sp. NPDC050310 TaxID=3154935 RepID=UPI0033C4B06D
MPAPVAVRRYRPLPALSYGEAAERAIEVDQTNFSVVAGERVVVKWIIPPAPLPHPAPEVLGHLVEAGFNETAPPYAAVTVGDHLVALVTGFLPGARDGWEWCVDFAESGETAFAPVLGHLAAGLHLALATLPVEPAPETPPGARPRPPDDARRAAEALREALELTDGDDGDWLAGRAETMRRELAGLEHAVEDRRIRIHGDFHVGQILQWDGGYAVIDFDGNPTVSEPGAARQPAARDVAQLTTSLEHVAQVAVLRRGTPPEAAATWAREAREKFLAAYRERAGDLLDERLIRPFEVEQECRELIYAARHLPRWRYAPMGVLRTWYPDDPDDPAPVEETP